MYTPCSVVGVSSQRIQAGHMAPNVSMNGKKQQKISLENRSCYIHFLKAEKKKKIKTPQKTNFVFLVPFTFVAKMQVKSPATFNFPTDLSCPGSHSPSEAVLAREEWQGWFPGPRKTNPFVGLKQRRLFPRNLSEETHKQRSVGAGLQKRS